MKALGISLLVLVIGQCSAYLIRVPTAPLQPRIGIAPVGWVHIQKLLFPLFENVCEESTNEVVIRLAGDFTLDSSTNGVYTKPDVIDNLRNIQTSKGLLTKGEIFTEYNISHMNELKALYEVLYNARDFDTFYKAACWARQNVNCGLFVDAIYLAIMNRKDTAKISVPAPYELIPNYFIQKEVIVKASTLLAGEEQSVLEGVRVENNAYILDANYTVDINDANADSKLAYFREDIGLNSYYFLRKLRNAPWFNVPSNIDNNYGEYIFLMMKQFAARYDLERYANGLPELESLNWNSDIAAYNPMLVYSNGIEFGHRTLSAILGDSNELIFLKTIENNLATIVTHLRQAGHNKSQILNHLMEIFITSDKSYETIALQLLGCNVEVNDRQYSTLEHYLTSMRDPAYWRVNKKIVELIDDALNVLPRYTRKELYFPGVEVLNIETKKIMTSFEDFQFDVTDSLKTTSGNTNFLVKIAQPRLNHKPFTMKLNISSLVTQKGLVKIYLGPRTLPGEFALKKHLFVLLDRFELDLKRGSNIVPRSSLDMKSFSDDFSSLRTVRKNIEDAEFGLDSLPLKDVEEQVGYPSRLILPKGSPEGLPLQLFVFVAPFNTNNFGVSSSTANLEFNIATLSAGYPLDLDIDEKQLFNLPNVLVKDIIVTHKGESKVSSYNKSGPKSWDSNKPYDSSRFDYSTNKQNDYEKPQYGVDGGRSFDYTDEKIHDLLSDRPAFTYKNKNSFDNSAKRNQYKNRGDYTSRRYEEKTVNEPTDKSIDFESLNTKSKETVNNIAENKHLEEYKKSNIVLNNIHGLLGSNPNFINSGKNTKRDPLLSKDDYLFRRSKTTKQSINKNKDDHAIQHFLSTDDKIFKNQEDSKYLQSKTNDNIENHHGLVGGDSDFAYKKKETKDFSEKETQYKEKKEKYETKRAQYKIKDYKDKVNNENTSFTDTNVEQNDLKNKDYGRKTIVIEEDKNIVNKSFSGNDSNKNVYVDKSNGEKYDTIIKEIVKGPYIDQNKKDDKQYSTKEGINDLQAVEDYVEDSDYSITYDPIRISEIPKRRVSVYDYLFNYNNENEKIY